MKEMIYRLKRKKAWYCNYTFELVDDLIMFLMNLHMEQSEIYWMQQFGFTEWTK